MKEIVKMVKAIAAEQKEQREVLNKILKQSYNKKKTTK